MTLRAPPELLKNGQDVEQRMFDIISLNLKVRKSEIVVKRGSDDARENGRWGDILLCPSKFEAPMMGLEAKGPTYPYSVTLSHFEKVFSQTSYFIVDGTAGIWCCPTDEVVRVAEEMEKGGDKYWKSEPPLSSRISLKQLLDRIQVYFGETPCPL